MSAPSIRRTLLIRCGLGAGILALLLSLSIFFVVRQGLYEELDQSITETASILANQMEYEHGGIIFEWQEGIGTNSDISDQALFQYWNEKTGLTTRSPALGKFDLPKFSGPGGNPDLETITIPNRIEHARALGMIIYPYLLPGEKLEMKRKGLDFEPKNYPHTLVVARDLAPVLRTLTSLAVTLAIGTLLIFVLGFFLIRNAVNFSLAPLERLTRQVLDRSADRLDSAIIMPVSLPLELVPLAGSFDSLLSRVASVRDREKDFIRHASHELRTPIAGLSATTELALSKDREATEYRRHLETCSQTAVELGELVKRLSALARLGQQSAPGHLENVDILSLLTTLTETFAARFDALKIHVSLPNQSANCSADPVLLRLIFNNLLDNAASYSPCGSSLEITFVNTVKHTEISFTNPATETLSDPDRLFEPLFRHDKSRTQGADSHLGIGLTLSRDAALAMGATLTASRPDPERIRFTLILPSSAA